LSGPQRTILFLIADTGAGHRSAANALRNAIHIVAQKRHEDSLERDASEEVKSESALASYRIEIVDVFDEYSHFPLREAIRLYGPTIRYRPKLYGRIYQFSNQAQRFSAMKSVSTPLIHNGLLRLIKSVKPDVIVSVHPLLNHVTLRILKELAIPVPFITVVTDLVSAHHAWFAPGADAYIVPTTYARDLALKQGMDPKRVHLLGMPIDPKFSLKVESKQELKQKLGLKPDIPVVLLVGGGEGAMGLRSSVQAISHARLHVQLLIIAGRNKRLYVQLQRIRSSLHTPAKVFGFVQNMHEMMRASDVIVTKAGPGTICEALACRLPIILSGYVPGQEEGNVTYVEENEVGSLAYDSIELINILRRLLKPGSELLRLELENAERISRPAASLDIANCVLDFLPPTESPGIWKTDIRQGTGRAQSSQHRSDISTRTLQPGRRALRSRTAVRTLRRRLKHLAFLQRPVHDLSKLRSQLMAKQEQDPNVDPQTSTER
jgi:1,2-diacylglycerol 3-beta-galactosyltransferase